MIRDVQPGSGSRFYTHAGVKKAPDPGTLPRIQHSFTSPSLFTLCVTKHESRACLLPPTRSDGIDLNRQQHKISVVDPDL
jgi:hypothetical protein